MGSGGGNLEDRIASRFGGYGSDEDDFIEEEPSSSGRPEKKEAKRRTGEAGEKSGGGIASTVLSIVALSAAAASALYVFSGAYVDGSGVSDRIESAAAAKISPLEKKIERLSSKLDEVSNVQKRAKKMTRIDMAISMSRLEKSIFGIEKRLSELEKSVEKNRARIEGVSDMTLTVSEKVGVANDRVEKVLKNLKDTDAIEERIGVLDEKLSSLESSAAKAAAGVASIRTEIGKIDARLSSLEKRVENEENPSVVSSSGDRSDGVPVSAGSLASPNVPFRFIGVKTNGDGERVAMLTNLKGTKVYDARLGSEINGKWKIVKIEKERLLLEDMKSGGKITVGIRGH